MLQWLLQGLKTAGQRERQCTAVSVTARVGNEISRNINTKLNEV